MVLHRHLQTPCSTLSPKPNLRVHAGGAQAQCALPIFARTQNREREHHNSSVLTDRSILELKLGGVHAGGAQAPQYAMQMGSPFASTQSMDGPEAPAPPAQQSIEESSDDEDESTIAVEATKVSSSTGTGTSPRGCYMPLKRTGSLVQPVSQTG